MIWLLKGQEARAVGAQCFLLLFLVASIHICEVSRVLSITVQNLLNYMKIIQSKYVSFKYHSCHLEHPVVLISIDAKT